ncbi:MAG: hypothetical protein ABSD29_16015 [Verrucomicrobiota bacterium]
MRRVKRLLWSVVAIGSCVFANCVHQKDASPGRFSGTVPQNRTLLSQGTTLISGARSVPDERQRKGTHYQEGSNASAMIDWGKGDKDNEERLRNPHPSDWHLPNFEAGAGRPDPIFVNFYAINDRQPLYLLCQYDVDEKTYDHTKEAEWFKAALRQIRRAGSQKFPPIKWVVIMIVNRGEFKGASTSEQCCKVAAIFKASDVFNHWRNLSRLIARVDLDRHPFLLDKQQPTPGDQQRWVIVERHAATNHTATSSQQR